MHLLNLRKEKLQKEALKYEFRNEFKKGSPKAYDRARKLKLLNEICSHMKCQRESWTFENIQSIALKYQRRIDFQNGNSKAYEAAKHRGILDKVCSHMVSERTSWNDTLAEKEAKKYKSKVEFKRKSPVAYRYAKKKGIFEKITDHMTNSRTQWDNLLLSLEAKKYRFRAEFQAGSASAYNAAIKRGISDEICSHMDRQASLKSRCIYVILFPEESAFYVGMTWDFQTRMASHRTNSSNKHVKLLMSQNSLFKEIIEIESVEMNRAPEKEELTRVKYKGKGYRCLNIAKTGGLGSFKVFWTNTKIIKEAKKYSTRTEFRNGSPGAYDAALNFEIIDEACNHMKIIMKKRTVNQIIEETQKFKCIKELLMEDRNLYMAAWRRKLLPQITKYYCN